MRDTIKYYYYHSATSNPRTTMHAVLSCVGQALLRLYPTVYTSEDRLVYKLTNTRIMTYYHLKFPTEEQAVVAAKTAFSHEAERAKRKQAEFNELMRQLNQHDNGHGVAPIADQEGNDE